MNRTFECREFTDWPLYDGGTQLNGLPDQKVILEIGIGRNPIARTSQDLVRKIREGALYFGIDRQVALFTPGYVKSILVQGDLGTLPLADGVADEIWLSNVFNEMDKLETCHWPIKLPNGEYTTLSQQYLAELARVLKPQGEIIIKEDIHPLSYWLRTQNWRAFGLAKEDFSWDINSRKCLEFAQRYDLTYTAYITESLLMIISKTN